MQLAIVTAVANAPTTQLTQGRCYTWWVPNGVTFSAEYRRIAS